MADQLDEAKRLKESIDRRSATVSNFLHNYLSMDEYADYDHFVKMKAKLIMDSREISDKIILGEEQIKALKESLYLRWRLWYNFSEKCLTDWLTWLSVCLSVLSRVSGDDSPVIKQKNIFSSKTSALKKKKKIK